MFLNKFVLLTVYNSVPVKRRFSMKGAGNAYGADMSFDGLFVGRMWASFSNFKNKMKTQTTIT